MTSEQQFGYSLIFGFPVILLGFLAVNGIFAWVAVPMALGGSLAMWLYAKAVGLL
jgi:hypothetical protein